MNLGPAFLTVFMSAFVFLPHVQASAVLKAETAPAAETLPSAPAVKHAPERPMPEFGDGVLSQATPARAGEKEQDPPNKTRTAGGNDGEGTEAGSGSRGDSENPLRPASS